MRYGDFTLELSERDDGFFVIVRRMTEHPIGIEFDAEPVKIFGPYRSGALALERVRAAIDEGAL